MTFVSALSSTPGPPRLTFVTDATIQPIAVQNVLDYLVAALEVPTSG